MPIQSPFGNYADLSSYRALVDAQKAQQLQQGGALNQLIGNFQGGVQQGNDLANLPQILAQQNQMRTDQANQSAYKTQLLNEALQNQLDPNRHLADTISAHLAIQANTPGSGVGTVTPGIGMVQNPGLGVSPDQQAAMDQAAIDNPLIQKSNELTGLNTPLLQVPQYTATPAQAPNMEATVNGKALGYTLPTMDQYIQQQNALSQAKYAGVYGGIGLKNEQAQKALENQLAISEAANAAKTAQISSQNTSRENVAQIRVGGMSMSPEAANQQADIYNLTGVMPNLGPIAKMQVYNTAADKRQAVGDTSGAMVIRKSEYNDIIAAKKKLETQRAPIAAATATANLALNMVEQLAPTISNTDIPLLQSWVNSGMENLSGDPNISKYQAAIRTAVNEISKVTNFSTGGAASTNSARKEISDVLNASMSSGQISGVAGVLRQEMGNRNQGFDQEMAILDGRLQQLGSAFNAPVNPTQNNPNPNAPSIGTVKTFPNGNKGIWDGTGWKAQ